MDQFQIKQRLSAIRQHMISANIDFYLVPISDQHFNEYVPACWQRLKWLSGFTGSSGWLLVGLGSAYFTTDGRYTLQSQQQLDNSLFEIQTWCGGFSPMVWAAEHAKDSTLGYDPALLSHKQRLELEASIQDRQGSLKCLPQNLVDVVWEDQPQRPQKPIVAHAIQYSGESTQDKLGRLTHLMRQQQAEYLLVTKLDQIAWLTNLRGSDIDYNPLFLSYVLVSHQQVVLYLDAPHLTQEVKNHIQSQPIQIKAYADLFEDLVSLSGSIWVDPQTVSSDLIAKLGALKIIQASNPIDQMKSCKNKVEQAGAVEAHLEDAVAVIRFLSWLDEKEGINEIEASDHLEAIRRENPNCKGLSFASISGFGPNGAVIHYQSTPETCRVIDQNSLYLIDSGGQYVNGTTDITRTIHLGEPTPEQKRHYTLVLKGHIRLARACFPRGTSGVQLDVLARMDLWQEGLNYGHGTGHGVGSFLCVHEGPQSISPALNGAPLCAGQILSNEPGYYREDHYGIRLENLVLVEEKIHDRQSNNSSWLSFKDLTLVPYCSRLIEVSMLDATETEWLEAYYRRIMGEVYPRLGTPQRHWVSREMNAVLNNEFASN